MQIAPNFTQLESSPEYKVQRAEFQCLLVVAAAVLLLFLLEDRLGGIAYLYLEQYLLIPAALFLGFALSRKLSRQAVGMLLLSATILAWFLISQTGHRILEQTNTKIGVFFCAYAMFLPFAAVTQDEVRQRGLKIISALFLTVGALLVIAAGLLVTGLLPAYLHGRVYWDGTRFYGSRHPNICATLLMIGIAFAMGAFMRTRKRWLRGALLVFLAALFAVASLTNGRTTLVFTCFLIGGVVFCSLRKTGWKRFLVALLAGMIVMGGLFTLSGKLYAANAERLSSMAQQNNESSQMEQIQKPITNGQGTWENDLRTLNGRTGIWKSAVEEFRENPGIQWIGTEYVSMVVSQANPFPVEHTHNSWLEALYRMGYPGLALALVLTAMAVWDAAILLWRNDDVWKSCIALLTLCLLGCGMLEPYLFVVDINCFFLDFLFLMCLGYMNLWCKRCPEN